MKNYMEYKGYRGTISYCGEDRILYGKVLGTKNSISYEGESVSELESDFHAAVDDYLEVCKETGKSPPSKEFKGSFNVHVTPELHRSTYFYAHENGLTLNELMSRSLKNYLDEKIFIYKHKKSQPIGLAFLVCEKITDLRRVDTSRREHGHVSRSLP